MRLLRLRGALLAALLVLALAAGWLWQQRERLAAHHLREGWAVVEAGRPRHALGSFTLAILLTPEQPTAYLARAEVYLRLELPARALADLHRAVARRPGDTALHLRRGLLLAGVLRRPVEAIADFDAVLRAAPEDAEAWYRRGLAYDQINNPHQAVKDYSRALELAPERLEAWVQRAHLHRRFRDHRAEVADLTQALRLLSPQAPEGATLHRRRAEAWLALGDPERAQADLARVVAAEPSAASFYQRGTVLMLLGRYRAAVADFSQAIARNPYAAVAYHSRGLAWRALGEHARARRDFATACDLRGGNPSEACAPARGE